MAFHSLGAHEEGLDRLGPVTGLGDDRQVRFALQYEPHAAADERVVVGEYSARSPPASPNP